MRCPNGHYTSPADHWLTADGGPLASGLVDDEDKAKRAALDAYAALHGPKSIGATSG